MSWKKSDSLFGRQLRQHGLGKAVVAGMVCQEAERLYPGLFRATALVNGALRVTVTPENQIPFRLIEGKLLEELKAYTTPRQLPIPTRIRLTVQASSDIL